MTAAKKKEVVSAVPTVRISDYHHLEGPLWNGQYPTFKGRCILQIASNAAFSAYAIAKNEKDSGPVTDAAAQAMLLEQSCMPYKEGVDASLVEVEKPELAGKKPRTDLIFDLLYRPDLDPDAVKELALSMRNAGIEAQIKSIVRKNLGGGTGGSKGVAKRIAAGFHMLEACDETWDEAFLTSAMSFLVDYQNEDYLRGEFDKTNFSYMKAVLAGVQPGEEEDGPIVFDL